MPILFRDHTEVADLGFAGYLRMIDEPDGKGLRGALFVVNGRAEPLDFCFNRVDVPSAFLWRAGEARRQAVKAVCSSLFAACPREPALLLVLASEVPPLLFPDDLEVFVPVGRVADGESIVHAASESPEDLGTAVHLFWTTGPPPTDSSARNLLGALQSRGLVTEPFDRAACGLEEAFAAK